MSNLKSKCINSDCSCGSLILFLWNLENSAGYHISISLKLLFIEINGFWPSCSTWIKQSQDLCTCQFAMEMNCRSKVLKRLLRLRKDFSHFLSYVLWNNNLVKYVLLMFSRQLTLILLYNHTFCLLNF